MMIYLYFGISLIFPTDSHRSTSPWYPIYPMQSYNVYINGHTILYILQLRIGSILNHRKLIDRIERIRTPTRGKLINLRPGAINIIDMQLSIWFVYTPEDGPVRLTSFDVVIAVVEYLSGYSGFLDVLGSGSLDVGYL